MVLLSKILKIINVDKVKDILRNKQNIFFAKFNKDAFNKKLQLKESREEKKSRKANIRDRIANLEYDQNLLKSLKDTRKEIADIENVPTFVVFNDATLIEMAAFKPQDKTRLLAINGVGQHKLEKYGDKFIQVIKEF